MGKKVEPVGSEVGSDLTSSGATVVATHHSHKKTILLIAIALVLIFAIGGGYWFWQKRDDNTKTAAPTTPQAQYKAVDESLKTQFDQGDYRKTVQTINTYLATNPPQEYVKQVTVQQGAAYLNDGDYTNALAWYNKALAMSDTPFEKMASIHGLAATYEASGDKAAALEQYKAAYAIAKPLSATNDQALRLASRDERKIKLLGGTP